MAHWSIPNPTEDGSYPPLSVLVSGDDEHVFEKTHEEWVSFKQSCKGKRMTRDHRERLHNFRVAIVQDMDLNFAFEYLTKEGIFNKWQMEHVQSTMTFDSTLTAKRTLLENVQQAGEVAYYSLCRCIYQQLHTEQRGVDDVEDEVKIADEDEEEEQKKKKKKGVLGKILKRMGSMKDKVKGKPPAKPKEEKMLPETLNLFRQEVRLRYLDEQKAKKEKPKKSPSRFKSKSKVILEEEKEALGPMEPLIKDGELPNPAVYDSYAYNMLGKVVQPTGPTLMPFGLLDLINAPISEKDEAGEPASPSSQNEVVQDEESSSVGEVLDNLEIVEEIVPENVQPQMASKPVNGMANVQNKKSKVNYVELPTRDYQKGLSEDSNDQSNVWILRDTSYVDKNRNKVSAPPVALENADGENARKQAPILGPSSEADVQGSREALDSDIPTYEGSENEYEYGKSKHKEYVQNIKQPQNTTKDNVDSTAVVKRTKASVNEASKPFQFETMLPETKVSAATNKTDSLNRHSRNLSDPDFGNIFNKMAARELSRNRSQSSASLSAEKRRSFLELPVTAVDYVELRFQESKARMRERKAKSLSLLKDFKEGKNNKIWDELY